MVFAGLSVEEQIEFAKRLLEKINSENTFSAEANFEFQDVESGSDGSLLITASTDTIRISRKAAWSAGDEEGAYDDPGFEADYINHLNDDAKKSFKTLVTVVDGYTVSLQIDDVEEDETSDADIEIDNISHEDDGIGSYEYWGFTGYDSHPYVEVEGTITRYCGCNITLSVTFNN